jgi:ABC-type phosphate/phosphonate transport system permease subunit
MGSAKGGSRAHPPHPTIFFVVRTLLSLFRTVPDLVPALLFVVDFFQYGQSATAVLAIFALVIAVEQCSGAVCRRLIGQT